MKNLSFEDENLKKYDFPWTFFLELFFGENQDPKEEFKQKTTLLQNCSRLVIFLAVFRWIISIYDYFINVTDNDYDNILYEIHICGKIVLLYA